MSRGSEQVSRVFLFIPAEACRVNIAMGPSLQSFGKMRVCAPGARHPEAEQRRVASAGLMLGVGKSRVRSWAAGPRREAPALAPEPQGEGRRGQRA